MKTMIALLLALTMLLSLCACGGSPAAAAPDEDAAALTRAVYPSMAPFPDMDDYLTPSGQVREEYDAALDAWWADLRARRELGTGTGGALDAFCAAALPALLSGNDGENRIVSPLNLYLALGMLTEVTDGETRAQILSLLGETDADALRRTASALWNANYLDDGATVSRLAASLWLDKDRTYDEGTLRRLAESWYASAYAGEMGSDALNEALRAWLSRETGGRLDEAVGGVATAPETVLALAATVYFKARWTNEFSPSATEDAVFHADGGDLTVPFMRQSMPRTYYWGKNYAAVCQHLESGGAMWLLLPDEGVTPEALLSDPEALAFLLSPREGENQKYLTVHLSVPRFDVTSRLDLVPALRALGVTDVTDRRLADFSPLTEDAEGIFLSQAEHAARVTVDEEGCEAAAYTVMMAAGAAMPPEEEVDLVLDRPFLFTITGAEDVPLFIGTVHTPAE